MSIQIACSLRSIHFKVIVAALFWILCVSLFLCYRLWAACVAVVRHELSGNAMRADSGLFSCRNDRVGWLEGVDLNDLCEDTVGGTCREKAAYKSVHARQICRSYVLRRMCLAVAG